MSTLQFSQKGQDLIALYEKMAVDGYERRDSKHVDNAFSDFELRPYRAMLLNHFQTYKISTVLDYGCGGSDWTSANFDPKTGQSAIAYFNLNQAYHYEPARDVDERQSVDCVVSFDVLEHIFIADIPAVLRDMFSYAKKLVALNIACYPAAARLPNGENAHISVRPPLWWKGMLDSIAVEFPSIAILLLCSEQWHKSGAYPIWKANDWHESKTFVIQG